MDERTVDHLVAAVAMSLYKYNVAPIERATKLYDHFSGLCAEMHELLELRRKLRRLFKSGDVLFHDCVTAPEVESHLDDFLRQHAASQPH